MRILFTMQSAPHGGGAESMLNDLMGQLVSRGHRVTLLTSNRRPCTDTGIEIVSLPYPSRTITGPLTAARTLWAALLMWLRIGIVLLRRRVDVVCVGSVGLELFSLLVWQRMQRFRFVIYLHGVELRSGVKVSRAMRWALGRALHTCDAAITVSQTLKAEAIRFQPSAERKIVVLPKPIDTRAFSTVAVAATCDQHLRAYMGESGSLAIAVVSTFFEHDAANSGLSSFYYTLCRSLVELGHDVRLFTSAENARPGGLNGIRLTTLRTTQKSLVPSNGQSGAIDRLTRASARMRFAWEAFWQVRRMNRHSGVDLIVAPELFAPGFFMALFMRRKLITRLHTPTVLVDAYNRVLPVWLTRLAAAPERFQVVRSGGVSAASSRLIRAVSREWRIPASRIALIPNGIRIDACRTLAAAQRREIDGDYLLYFGRLEPRKGVHVLTDALEDVFGREPSIKAIYVGNDGGLKTAVLKSPAFATGRIQVFDTMDRARLLGVVMHARLVVLPSLFENVSNAALESMALARPLIGTRGTAFEELIEDGVNGFLAEPGDRRSLAATISLCLEHQNLPLIGQRALDSIRQYESLAVGRQHVSFMRSVRSGRGRSERFHA